MRSAHSACLALVLAFGGFALGLVSLAGASGLFAADPPATASKSGPADKKAEPVPAAPPPAAKPEPFRVPGDYIIFIGDKLDEALRMAPQGLVIPNPRKFQQDLFDLFARQNEQAKQKKPVSPSQCQITGKIEGNAAVLRLQFDCLTQWPDALVHLACIPGWASSASIDGRTPLLRPEPDGFQVQVDKPGDHQVVLDLVVPLAARSPGQALELSLPHAAITTLELDLPPGAKDVRFAGKPLAEGPVKVEGNRLVKSPLGPADKLDLSWRGPRATPGVPLLAAEGLVRVRLDGDHLTTVAELTLRAEAGQTDVWRLLVPHGAEVQLSPADKARLARPVEAAEQAAGSLLTLRLREPSADPLKVTVITPHRLAPKPAATVAVGPFAVLGAVHQSGTLFVSSNLTDVQLDFQPHPGAQAINLQRRLLTEEERRGDSTRVAAFRYGNVSAADGAPAPVAGLGPWLDISAGLVHGQLRTRVNHVLSLQNRDGTLVWHSNTTIVATTPRWAEVDQVKVQLPDGWEPSEDLGATPSGTPRVVALRLARGSKDAVTLTLAGRYADKPKTEGSATLGLPRPLGAIDQGGDVTVQVAHDLEVVPAVPAGLELTRQSPHDQVWHCRTLPEAMAVAWRPYVPDVRVRSEANVDLTPRGGRVQQWITLQLPQPPPTQVTLRVPAGITGLALREGGTLAAPEERGAAARSVTLGKPSGGGEHLLALDFDFTAAPRPGEAANFVVPLVYPEPMTRGESRVRLWCDAGALPVLLDGTPWTTQPIEDVAERTILPALVARAPRADAPLPLRWGEPQGAFTVLAERALVRVRIDEDGSQRCTARYRLRQLAAPHIDVEVPGPVAVLNFQATLNGKRVAHEVLDDAGQPSDGGRLARLRLAPDLVKPDSILELSYRVPPGRPSTGAWAGTNLTTPLQAPVLRGEAGAIPICWEVRVPPSWVVLAPESSPGVDRTWGRRGWLLAPHLARVSSEPDSDSGGEEAAAQSGDPPAVVSWRSGPEPLTLTHVPQKAWMLACSLGLVVVGLVLYGPGRPARQGSAPARGLAWVLVLLALAAAAGAVLRPTVLAALVYGCEPGAVVLLVVLLVRWLLHERYRRQIVFLPSFSRGRSGSSMLRGSSASRPTGEPSTVDVPRPAAGSAAK